AALVHEGDGLDQADGLAAPLTPGDDARAIASPGRTERSGERVETPLAHVVAGVPILRTGISQPNHHVGHAAPDLLLVLLGFLGARRSRRLLVVAGRPLFLFRLSLCGDLTLCGPPP